MNFQPRIDKITEHLEKAHLEAILPDTAIEYEIASFDRLMSEIERLIKAHRERI